MKLVISIAPNVAPRDLTVDRLSGTTMNVSWVPLTIVEARGFILNYLIEYSEVGSSRRRKRQTTGSLVEVPASQSSVLINDLTPGVSYNVGVTAANSAGSSPGK